MGSSNERKLINLPDVSSLASHTPHDLVRGVAYLARPRPLSVRWRLFLLAIIGVCSFVRWPELGGCPLLGVSVIGGSTVYVCMYVRMYVCMNIYACTCMHECI